MAYLLHVHLPDNQIATRALGSIFGIGYSRARLLCSNVGIGPKMKSKELTLTQISQLSKLIEMNYLCQEELLKEIQTNIKRLISIKCYRGFRHFYRLPVRGQRTHTNAQTSKHKKT
jgi:small subunit ribosomal protein S13